ncbi:MAG: Uma2 family endonuclease [Chloroflexota bacterium]|nr:Uma2 family endonuclease [Chloroflexota bacterium]
MPGLEISALEQLLREGAVKLEITGGIPTWEVSPSSRHQRMLYRIQTSIKPLPGSDKGCKCAQLSDVYIRFPEGSLKRPDISIFCAEPPDQDEALTIVPQAVIEIVSPGYEYKDIALNPEFYLAQGVLDVVVVDPHTGVVTHYRTNDVQILHTPITVEMQCGCQCDLP